MSEAEAWRRQKELCQLLGGRRYDRYTPSQRVYLQIKVGHVLCGSPDIQITTQSTRRLRDYYSDDDVKVIMKLFKKIENLYDEDDDMLVAIIFISAIFDDEVHHLPVFRVKAGTRYFIDITGRVYKGWHDFTSHNVLPACEYLHPSNGIYNDRDPLLEWSNSPAADDVTQSLNVLDKTADIGGLAAAGIGVAGAFFAPAVLTAATAVAVTASVYGGVRAFGKLFDRVEHEESIKPTESGARGYWMDVASATIDVATLGASRAVRLATAEGRIATRGLRLVRVLKISKLSIKGVKILNKTSHMILHRKRLNPYEAVVFTASLFFFTHSLVTFELPSMRSGDSRTMQSTREFSYRQPNGVRSITTIRSAPELHHLLRDQISDENM